MKRLILLMSALVLCTNVTMADDPGDDGKVDINPPEKPLSRSIMQPVIDCTLHTAGMTGTLTFDITTDLGDASIMVTNLSTGDVYTEYCPSTPACCAVSISRDEGSYIIEIDTADGVYYGEFVL